MPVVSCGKRRARSVYTDTAPCDHSETTMLKARRLQALRNVAARQAKLMTFRASLRKEESAASSIPPPDLSPIYLFTIPRRLPAAYEKSC